jgi:hypothetical protein
MKGDESSHPQWGFLFTVFFAQVAEDGLIFFRYLGKIMNDRYFIWHKKYLVMGGGSSPIYHLLTMAHVGIYNRHRFACEQRWIRESPGKRLTQCHNSHLGLRIPPSYGRSLGMG